MSVDNEILIKKDEPAVTSKSISDITQVANEQLAKFDSTYRAPDLSKLLVTEKKLEEEIGQPLFELDLDNSQDEEKDKTQVSHQSAALTLKAKLIIGVTAVIMVLLSALLIYNATLISKYKGDIAYNTEVLQVEQERLNGLMEQLEGLNTQSATDLGLSETTNRISLPKLEKLSRTEYTEDSNWFDAICEFFSSILGG